MKTWPCLFLLMFTFTAHAQNPIQAAKDALNKAKQQRTGQPSQGQPGQAGASPAANDTGPFAVPPGIKVESTLLAPQEQGAQFSVSPHGIHMVTQSHNGSRPVMIYDGVPGPKFDQIFTQGMSLAGAAFSPDGQHYAYCGQQGSEFVVMLDGKELYRSSDSQVSGIINMNSCGLMSFTSNSKHLYFVVQSKFETSHDAFRFVFDGKASQQSMGADLRDFAFSPDGDHFAYVWTSPAARGPGTEKLIVDGKPSPITPGAPQWSADSRHLYTTIRVNGGRTPYVELQEDGKQVLRADDIRLYVPPVGNMAVALATKVSGLPAPHRFLVIDGKVVPGSEQIAPNSIGDVVISDDGKHYAAKGKLPNGHEFVFADGKRGQDYTRFDLFHAYGPGVQPRYVGFTPAGNPVFVGFNGTAQFINVGGEEWPQLQYLTELAISPTGNRVVASALHQLQLDGKSVSMPTADQIYSLKFSPDGQHLAMAVQSRAGITIFLDGTPQTAFGAASQIVPVFSFSPDGKHLAYACHSSNPAAGNDQGICLDGKYTSVGATTPQDLIFSNDSNHLFWNKRTPQGGFRTFVDGKPVYDGFMPTTSGFTKETWQADGPSGLLLLSRDPAGMKRVSIIP